MTRNLAFATNNMVIKATRKVMDQLGGNDNRPIANNINIEAPAPSVSPLPR